MKVQVKCIALNCRIQQYKQCTAWHIFTYAAGHTGILCKQNIHILHTAYILQKWYECHLLIFSSLFSPLHRSTHTHRDFRKTTLALSHTHTNLHLISSPSATLLLCLMDRVTWFPKKKRCSGEHSPRPHSALKFSIFTSNLVQSEGLVSLFSVDLRPLSCRSVFDCSQEW